ncbi:MAG: hypothetical protein ACOC7T_01325 [Planctomycetota bacterium]
MAANKFHLWPRARALYERGGTLSEVADQLDVHRATLCRWSGKDAEAGRPWRRRPAPAEGPAYVRARLHQKLERMADGLAGDAEGEEVELADRMLKVCRVLEDLPEQGAGLEGLLQAMRRFMDFCLQRLPEEQTPPVRRAVRMFVENLKEEHT